MYMAESQTSAGLVSKAIADARARPNAPYRRTSFRHEGSQPTGTPGEARDTGPAWEVVPAVLEDFYRRASALVSAFQRAEGRDPTNDDEGFREALQRLVSEVLGQPGEPAAVRKAIGARRLTADEIARGLDARLRGEDEPIEVVEVEKQGLDGQEAPPAPGPSPLRAGIRAALRGQRVSAR